MPEDLATIADKTRSVIQDTASLLGIGGTPDDIIYAIREALEVYDNDAARTLVADQAGDGVLYDFTLPAGYVDGFSRFVAIEYPAGERPSVYLETGDWMIYRTATTTKLRLQSITPGSTEMLRMTYTARHTLDDLDLATATTIPTYHTEAFVSLCGAMCLMRLAARFVHEQESTLNLDAVDRTSKTDQARRLAEKLIAKYREIVGVSRGAAPGMIVANWQSSIAGIGITPLTHRRTG